MTKMSYSNMICNDCGEELEYTCERVGLNIEYTVMPCKNCMNERDYLMSELLEIIKELSSKPNYCSRPDEFICSVNCDLASFDHSILGLDCRNNPIEYPGLKNQTVDELVSLKTTITEQKG
jgi:hypothetical protein